MSLIAAGAMAVAQTAPAPGAPQNAAPNAAGQPGWTPVGQSAAGSPSQAPADPQGAQQAGPPLVAIAPPPAQLTIKPGTYITVRINQVLSSDHNQKGDAFTASLVRPIVVDGFVVAETGQTIAGQVADAQKAGRAKGVSHLAVQLTDLTLADGSQMPIQSELITRSGPTSEGRDATTIGTTTGIGAAIGAIAGGGPGAAIGAGAGAVASSVGVLLTRGRPSVITPESVLTFKIDNPVVVATDRAPQAFRPVTPADYNQPAQLQTARPARTYRPAPYYGYPGYGYPYGYPYYGEPYYWGPSIGVFYGGIGYGGHFHGRRR